MSYVGQGLHAGDTPVDLDAVKRVLGDAFKDTIDNSDGGGYIEVDIQTAARRAVKPHIEALRDLGYETSEDDLLRP